MVKFSNVKTVHALGQDKPSRPLNDAIHCLLSESENVEVFGEYSFFNAIIIHYFNFICIRMY